MSADINLETLSVGKPVWMSGLWRVGDHLNCPCVVLSIDKASRSFRIQRLDTMGEEEFSDRWNGFDITVSECATERAAEYMTSRARQLKEAAVADSRRAEVSGKVSRLYATLSEHLLKKLGQAK